VPQHTRRALSLKCAGLLSVIAVTLAAFGQATPPGTGQTTAPVSVSLVQLIATPDRYDGVSVRIKGFFHLEFEEVAVYLSRDDCAMRNSANAVWLRMDKNERERYRRHTDRFVMVEGLYSAREQGHNGGWAGVVTRIARLERALTREELEVVAEAEKIHRR
jgi:hypothetical protein